MEAIYPIADVVPTGQCTCSARPRDLWRRLAWWAVRSHLSDRQFHRLPILRISHLTGLTTNAVEQVIADLVRDGIMECQGNNSGSGHSHDPCIFDALENAARNLAPGAEEICPYLEWLVQARLGPVHQYHLLSIVKRVTNIPLTVLRRQVRDISRRSGDSRDQRMFRLTGRGLSSVS